MTHADPLCIPSLGREVDITPNAEGKEDAGWIRSRTPREGMCLWESGRGTFRVHCGRNEGVYLQSDARKVPLMNSPRQMFQFGASNLVAKLLVLKVLGHAEVC